MARRRGPRAFFLGDRLPFETKPGLLSFVVGRSLPTAACTVLYAGSPLFFLSPEDLWSDPWFWIGVLGLAGPFLYNFACWCSTRYRWTPTGLCIEQWGRRQTIEPKSIREVELDRGSVVLTVETKGSGTFPLYDVLTLRGVQNAAQVARRFYLEREIATTIRFGRTRTKRVG